MAEPSRAIEAARASLSADGSGDAAVHVRLAELALRAGKPAAAAAELEKVGTDSRDDAYWRLAMGAHRDAGEPWLDACLQLVEPTPEEARASASDATLCSAATS